MAIGGADTHQTQTIQRVLQGVFADRLVDDGAAFAICNLAHHIDEALF